MYKNQPYILPIFTTFHTYQTPIRINTSPKWKKAAEATHIFVKIRWGHCPVQTNRSSETPGNACNYLVFNFGINVRCVITQFLLLFNIFEYIWVQSEFNQTVEGKHTRLSEFNQSFIVWVYSVPRWPPNLSLISFPLSEFNQFPLVWLNSVCEMPRPVWLNSVCWLPALSD